jgi:hypothetical protein
LIKSESNPFSVTLILLGKFTVFNSKQSKNENELISMIESEGVIDPS